MVIKKIGIVSITIIMIIVVYFIWNANRQKQVARNELPPIQIQGVVQEKGNNEFSIKLSEGVEDLKKGTSIVVRFSDKVFDESNVVLKESEIRLYIDSLRIGENMLIFYPMSKINNTKQIEISRISNIIRGSVKDENEK
ncbi:hypothetical protein DOK67_0001318 [Enterococcus sp. DIV0212c]|uniref:hypothetical protein n=1 Tax=Enterococcus sp. DIV0212c TaxID=2230867 RepID=UPI001A9AAF6E|nr:hypothetical protein [Enterococcus sp. DIV0212c]MBO1355016.1 hypothetical protein [Enterococcus sp. DIV0212c]